MELKDKIFVAGHKGLVGSAIVRSLQTQGYENVLTIDRESLDLLDQSATAAFLRKEAPVYVFLAAAKVGGIHANSTYSADFIYENLQVQNNVIHGAHLAGVKKLCFLGSSCIYPKFAPQPMTEDALLTGVLEPTNEAYAIAKIAGIKMTQMYRKQYGSNFISVMPTNLYGPGDNFDLQNSHVLPALIRKFIEAAESKAPTVTIWGTGSPKREFLYVDDMADACVFLMRNYDSAEIVNIGTGKDISIRELAELIRDEVGYKGDLMFDSSKPDGTPRKLLDVSKLTSLGWKPKVSLRDGIRTTIDWYRKHRPS